MTPTELETYLTEFLTVARAAKLQYTKAVEREIFPNEAIQDILHVAEFAPNQLDEASLITKLHELRISRREAKKELEVTDHFARWADTHKKALDQLEQVLGEIRKTLKWQPRAHYIYKTGVVGEKGHGLVVEEEESNAN